MDTEKKGYECFITKAFHVTLFKNSTVVGRFQVVQPLVFDAIGAVMTPEEVADAAVRALGGEMNAKNVAAALEADFAFSRELRAHRLDRWSDSTKWPENVLAAFEAKKVADRIAFPPEYWDAKRKQLLEPSQC